MTIQQLNAFIEEGRLDVTEDENTKYIHVRSYALEDFCEMLGKSFFDNAPKVLLKYGYITIDAWVICGYFDFDIEDILILK